MIAVNATQADSMARAVAEAKRHFHGRIIDATPMEQVGFVVNVGTNKGELKAKIGFDSELTACPHMLVSGTPAFLSMCLNYATTMIPELRK